MGLSRSVKYAKWCNKNFKLRKIMTTPLSTLQRNFLEDGTGIIPSQLHPFMDKRRNREGLKGIFTLNSIYLNGIIKMIAKLTKKSFLKD